MEQKKAAVSREINGLLSALMLLTRLPVSAVKSVVPDTGMAVAWYPAVGLIIGCLLSLLYEVSVFAGISHLLLAALMLSLWVLVTGALHLDGLADMLDGWVGGMGDRERTLKIMKDPAVGAIGATGLMVIKVCRAVAFAECRREQYCLGRSCTWPFDSPRGFCFRASSQPVRYGRVGQGHIFWPPGCLFGSGNSGTAGAVFTGKTLIVLADGYIAGVCSMAACGTPST